MTENRTIGNHLSQHAFQVVERIGLVPLATVVLCMIYAWFSPRFATLSNVQNIIFQAGILGVVSFGQFFPVLGGGIDFSVGAQIGLASVVSAMLIIKLGIWAGIPGALLACAVVGFLIGWVITRFRANALIVSLGMFWLVSGLTLMLTDGQNIYGLPQTFSVIGVSRFFGIPISSIWALIAFLLCYFVLHKTRFGYELYAVGANERTAELSGINIIFTRIKSYVICSLLVGVAGLVLTASLGSSQPSLAGELSMQNFVVVFIAGTRWGGGEGSILKVALAVLFVAVLSNGLNIMNVSSYIQMAINGVILVAAICADILRRRWRS